MNFTVRGQLATAAIVVSCLVVQAAALAQNAYVANEAGNTVSVIDTTSNTVIGNLSVGDTPVGIAVTPDGNTVYVDSANSNIVSVIDAATNTITSTIPVHSPFGVAVTPDGSNVYVTNRRNFGTVSLISTATNTVTLAIPVGIGPTALSIQPTPGFFGPPEKANCHGQSISGLARQYGGLNNAAAALGYASVAALQDAIMAFCEG